MVNVNGFIQEIKLNLFDFRPSRTDGQIPQFCHTTGHKFDPTKLKSIEHELNVKWPNLLKGKGEYSLWKHEFEKHGSCAQQLPSLGDELLYFGKTLELHDQLMIAT
jgi:ribonuclease T2